MQNTQGQALDIRSRDWYIRLDDPMTTLRRGQFVNYSASLSMDELLAQQQMHLALSLSAAALTTEPRSVIDSLSDPTTREILISRSPLLGSKGPPDFKSPKPHRSPGNI
ncbi:hypothetical protein FALCPG4_013477 [Fusarium falciforme]